MIKVCEYCNKEYEWEEGQPNWGKDYPRKGKGSINSKRFCCYKCGKLDRNNKMKQTNIKLYGTICTLHTKEMNKRVKKTWLDKYGFDNPAKSKKILEKIKKTCNKKYGTDYYMNTQDFKNKSKQTCINKYNTDNYSKTYEFKNLYKNKKWVNRLKEKEYETKKQNQTSYYDIKDKLIKKSYETKYKNKSFNTSKSELKIYQLLIQKYGIDDIEWQYRSELYPFTCDFYIKSLNLYIEYQGTWTHGLEPFNKNSKKHQEILQEWVKRSQEINFKGNKKNYYKNAINVWTIKDPLKRQTAKNNNLNWLEFFTVNEFTKWYEKL